MLTRILSLSHAPLTAISILYFEDFYENGWGSFEKDIIGELGENLFSGKYKGIKRVGGDFDLFMKPSKCLFYVTTKKCMISRAFS